MNVDTKSDDPVTPYAPAWILKRLIKLKNKKNVNFAQILIILR